MFVCIGGRGKEGIHWYYSTSYMTGMAYRSIRWSYFQFTYYLMIGTVWRWDIWMKFGVRLYTHTYVLHKIFVKCCIKIHPHSNVLLWDEIWAFSYKYISNLFPTTLQLIPLLVLVLQIKCGLLGTSICPIMHDLY